VAFLEKRQVSERIMATLKGSSRAVKRFIGFHRTNLFNQITRRHNKSVGACEHCGKGGGLEAAHVHGRGRLAIIESILGHLKRSRDQIVEVDLCEFDTKFKEERSPVEKAILALRIACHRKYDRSLSGRSDRLPISLDPPNTDDVLKQLLRMKVAAI
jgi:hypothetical protein